MAADSGITTAAERVVRRGSILVDAVVVSESGREPVTDAITVYTSTRRIRFDRQGDFRRSLQTGVPIRMILATVSDVTTVAVELNLDQLPESHSDHATQTRCPSCL